MTETTNGEHTLNAAMEKPLAPAKLSVSAVVLWKSTV